MDSLDVRAQPDPAHRATLVLLAFLMEFAADFR